jgi:hypothetical protein
MASNASAEEIRATLKRDVEAGNPADHSPTTIAETLYASERAFHIAEEAAKFLRLYDQGRVDTLRSQATAMANYPRETIFSLQ